MDKELEAREEIGGITALDINQFYDQMSHDFWVDLKDKSQVVQRGKINLIVQWIHSKVL